MEELTDDQKHLLWRALNSWDGWFMSDIDKAKRLYFARDATPSERREIDKIRDMLTK